MKTGTAVLVAVGVVAAGGGAYLLWRRGAAGSDVRTLGAQTALLGARGVSDRVAAPPVAGAAPSPSFTNQVLGVGGKALDLLYPGVGSKAASVLQAVDSKVPLSKVVGGIGSAVGKLKFW